MAVRVVVFGPTGNVGSVAARTAREHGAEVFLAMRDPRKAIPGLSDDEAGQAFQRVQADLMDPDSITAAVTQTQTRAAFIYVAHGSPDHMQAALEALKAAGVTFVVFLSSFTIKQPLDQVAAMDRIPYVHARVEQNLERVYGAEHSVALRVGAFATNTLRWARDIQAGELKLDDPQTSYDFITPTDMGRVAGRLLAAGELTSPHIIYLYGPRLMPVREAFGIVAAALGKTYELVGPGDQASAAQQQHTAVDVRVTLGEAASLGAWTSTAFSNWQENRGNVEKFGGKPATEFQTWVEENTARYLQ